MKKHNNSSNIIESSRRQNLSFGDGMEDSDNGGRT